MTPAAPSPAPPSGMRDLLPAEVELRDFAMRGILDVYAGYGFARIETPAVESLRWLLRSDGGENEKLVFKILKRGEKLAAAAHADLADLGLRFDLTVPLARYYANNQARLPSPFRAIQIGPVWRAERPQKGRFRQFTQCDIDIIGMASHLAEVELLRATAEALLGLGLAGLRVRINDRRILHALLAAAGFDERASGPVLITLDKLDKIGPEGVEAEIVGQGHPRAAVVGLLRAVDRLAPRGPDAPPAVGEVAGVEAGVSRALTAVIEAVRADAAGRYEITFDPSLVRGMGYYTGPIFEIAHAGYGSSIAGGGRYDTMIERFLGRPVPASGFSIGFERVVSLLEARGASPAGGREKVVLLVEDALRDLTPVLREAGERRARGAVVIIEAMDRKHHGRQLYELARHGFLQGSLYERSGAVRPLTDLLAQKAAGPAR